MKRLLMCGGCAIRQPNPAGLKPASNNGQTPGKSLGASADPGTPTPRGGHVW